MSVRRARRGFCSGGVLLGLLLVVGCGGGSSGDSGPGIYIHASVKLVPAPPDQTIGASPDEVLVGQVVVLDEYEEQWVAAKLTVNGVDVPAKIEGGQALGYDLSQVRIPGAEAGGTLEMHAELNGSSADLTLRCPSDVTIIAPADHSQATAGDSVTLSWSGKVDYDNSAFEPYVDVQGFDPTTGASTNLGVDHEVSHMSSDTFMLPAPGSAPEWLVHLFVPGDLARPPRGVGTCWLDRQVHLVVK
jgi:hypothetical protein